MSSQLWNGAGQLLGLMGGTGIGWVVSATNGIIKAQPCASAPSPTTRSFEEIIRDFGKAPEPVEQCITVLGQTWGKPLADPYFQGFLCGAAVFVCVLVYGWQQRK
ncbi:MAG: hypothetical protein ABIW19_10945 [Vicinamibacterales bacterium]